MTLPAITIRNLVKRFGETTVLQDINLEIPEGKVSCLIGPSGSGKSTLLRSMAFLEEYDEGQIHIEGQLLGWQNADTDGPMRKRAAQSKINQVRQNVGMVFQQFNLWPHMTVLGNVCEALQQVRKQSKAQARERALAMLDKVGLAHKADAWPVQLSGGQQQRVAIARALAMEPHIMLFDEPTSALDPELVGEVLATIRSLAEEKRTMIIVTHEMQFARDVANRVVFFDKGVIVEQGEAKALFAAPKEERTRQFLSKFLAHAH